MSNLKIPESQMVTVQQKKVRKTVLAIRTLYFLFLYNLKTLKHIVEPSTMTFRCLKEIVFPNNVATFISVTDYT